jgi:transcription antitermination factor NusG
VLRWFCAETKPGCDDMAERHLLEQDFTVCNAKYVYRREYRGFIKDVVRPLFPGYVLVQFDPFTEGWQKINGTRGVRRLMCGAGEKPLPVHQGAMDQLLARLQSGPLRELDWMAYFTKGTSVKALDGPFAGLTGVVEYTDKQRIWVLFSLFGRSTPVAMYKDSLELVV